MPKVSIIVPVYNGEKYIDNTIKMLLDSSMQDIEIVVVDDESKDSSYAICKKYAELDERVKLYRKVNEGGVYATRNYGLARATGEYVCFCDQDDFVDKTMYERMYSEAVKCSADLIMCGTGRCINGIREAFEVLEDAEYNGREIINLILANLFAGTDIYSKNAVCLSNTIWKCMIKNECIKRNQIRFMRYVNFEDDWLFLLNVLACSQKIVTVSEVLYYWRINPNSETYMAKYVENMYNKDICVERHIVDIMKKCGIDQNYIDLFHKHYSCSRYIRLIENEQKNFDCSLSKKMDVIKVIHKEDDLQDNIQIAKYYHRNYFRKKVALFFVKHRQYKMAYLFLLMFRKIKMLCMENKQWLRLEKNLSKR